MHNATLLLFSVVAALAAAASTTTTTSPEHRCDPYLRQRHLQATPPDVLFGTLPPEGWSLHTVVSGGLEWLWASPVYVTSNYYEVYTNDTQNQDGPYGGDKFSTDNFPDSVRYSGFRLPTKEQVLQFKPQDPPPCMAAFANDGAFHCDLGDYWVNDIVTADEGCWHPSCDVVYVRPVGSMDRDYECEDSDGDSWCDEVDTCVNTSNILQGYAFEDPDATCSDITLELDAEGFAELSVSDLDNGAFDLECSIAAIELGKTVFDCGDVNYTTLILAYSVLDGNENLGSCLTNVTIVDSTPPNVTCHDVTVTLNSEGYGYIKNSMAVDTGSYDNCGIAWMEVTPSIFTCEDVGDPQPIVLAVMDVNGNIAFCDSEATIVNEPPTWDDPFASGVTVFVDDKTFSFQANISDPEGMDLTFAWDVDCVDEETIIFVSHSQRNEAQLVFPPGTQPNVCTVYVEACDVCGSCLRDSIEVAVVDPRAGSISGNGWFQSPQTSYMPSAIVSFEFDAGYEKGKSVPSGLAKVHTIDWEFHSSSYEWLVVTPEGCAQLKGSGSMVKEFGPSSSEISEYAFRLTICNNVEPSEGRKDHEDDSIRIRIWSTVTGKIVYDNRRRTDYDSFDHGTILGDGFIEIQVPKGTETESGWYDSVGKLP